MPQSSLHSFEFRQVDVFSDEALRGNPLAVVLAADEISDERMAAFANWTNLSETTFLLKPRSSEADYRVRIFTPVGELPFAGHPTLGTCHVWLSVGGTPKGRDIVQECDAGLVKIRKSEGKLAFAAPPLTKSGAVSADLLERILRGLGLTQADIEDAQWVANGPNWVGLLMHDRSKLLGITPDYPTLAGLDVGVCAPWRLISGVGDADYEVRAFSGEGLEDPVTGSLNAGIAQWLIGAGIAPSLYTVSQGTVLGRKGLVHVRKDDEAIWIGGAVTTCISGTVSL